MLRNRGEASSGSGAPFKFFSLTLAVSVLHDKSYQSNQAELINWNLKFSMQKLTIIQLGLKYRLQAQYRLKDRESKLQN